MSHESRPSRIRMPRLRITPSLLIAVLALIVALSGSATAAHVVTAQNMKKNAVGAKHIKKNAVKSKHISSRAVTSRHVRAGTIRQGHLAPDVRSKLNKVATPGAQGPQGEPGQVGPAGPQGATGAPGLSGVQNVSAKTVVPGYAMGAPYGYGTVMAVCPAGKSAIGGGGHWQYATNQPVLDNNTITNTAPRVAVLSGGSWSNTPPSGTTKGNAWIVSGQNGDDNDPRELVAWAICATVS